MCLWLVPCTRCFLPHSLLSCCPQVDSKCVSLLNVVLFRKQFILYIHSYGISEVSLGSEACGKDTAEEWQPLCKHRNLLHVHVHVHLLTMYHFQLLTLLCVLESRSVKYIISLSLSLSLSLITDLWWMLQIMKSWMHQRMSFTVC